jgi:hypothetical protein
MNSIKAFTFVYPDLATSIETKCGVYESYNNHKEPEQSQITTFNSLWDTGAMSSVISTKVVNVLGLIPVGRAQVFHANGEAIVNTYFVNIVLPNKVTFSNLFVTEGVLSDIDVLIGMDIISQGDFVITALNQGTRFSFQIPSTHDTDYVRELDLQKQI